MLSRTLDSCYLAVFSGGSYIVGMAIDNVTISPGTLITIITTVGTAAWVLNGRLTRIEQRLDDLPCSTHCPTKTKK